MAHKASLFGDIGVPMDVAKGEMPPTRDLTHAPRPLELESWAQEAFATEEEASDWLRQPHPLLDGKAPLDCAKSSAGARRVRDILMAIKHGGVV